MVWGPEPPVFSIGYDDPMLSSDSGYTVLFDDAPDLEEVDAAPTIRRLPSSACTARSKTIRRSVAASTSRANTASPTSTRTTSGSSATSAGSSATSAEQARTAEPTGERSGHVLRSKQSTKEGFDTHPPRPVTLADRAQEAMASDRLLTTVDSTASSHSLSG
jgi:hypothetical protein